MPLPSVPSNADRVIIREVFFHRVPCFPFLDVFFVSSKVPFPPKRCGFLDFKAILSCAVAPVELAVMLRIMKRHSKHI